MALDDLEEGEEALGALEKEGRQVQQELEEVAKAGSRAEGDSARVARASCRSRPTLAGCLLEKEEHAAVARSACDRSWPSAARKGQPPSNGLAE